MAKVQLSSRSNNIKLERIKSEFGILTQQKIRIASEMQDALMDFYGKYKAWITCILHVSILPPNDETSNKYIYLINSKLDTLFYDFTIAEAKIDLFYMNQPELIAAKDEIRELTMKLVDIISRLLNQQSYQISQLKCIKNYVNNDPDKEILLEDTYQNIESLQKQFIKERIKFNPDIIKLQYNLLFEINKQINSSLK